MKYNELLKQQKDYVISMRREFHENPEACLKEFNTSKRIKEELDKMGVTYREYAGTGVVGTIVGGKSGKTVGLRADIDALEIIELNDVDYKSKNEGIMHACGHDGHTAMLLGAAKALNEIKAEINGTVKLLFQPAEELLVGAKKMIEDGALEGIDMIYGQHLWNDVVAGKVNVEAGPRMASGDGITITFYGKGGHGSLPNQTVDPVVMASSFIMNVNALMSREKDPMEAMVFTLGIMQAGTRFNIIPDKASMSGTLRCFSEETRQKNFKSIERYAQATADMYGGRAEVIISEGTSVTTNDEKLAQIAQKTAEKLVGKENMILQDKTTGSEDMAYYLSEIPGVFAFVGCGYEDKEKSFPHHHPRFDINEESLEVGTNMYFNIAIDFLVD
jgi:amidohydrolase